MRVNTEEAVQAQLATCATIKAVVTEVNPGRQRLSLSIRELQRQQQRQELQKYIHDADDDATVTLGDMLKEKQDN